MVKEFIYRGKSLEELKQMDLREFAKFLPSRERRSVLRQTEIIEKFLKRCEKKIAKNKPIRTQNRSLVIVPKMIGLTIHIHNGKEFIPVKITEEMLGHRLGEFALTRKKVEHGAPGIGATRSSAFLSVK
ncbi:MAG: 30S ribosomal protein S19 [Candidatus Pacearchaeota archaeon]